MSRLLTVLAPVPALLFGCMLPTGGTGAVVEPDASVAASPPPQVILVREYVPVDADAAPPTKAQGADSGQDAYRPTQWGDAAQDGGLEATSGDGDASVTVTLGDDAATANCQATVNGSTVPWACDDVCDGVPCSVAPPVPGVYRPAIPSAASALPNDWVMYENNCYDANECPEAQPGLTDPASGWTGNTTDVFCTALLHDARVCTGPCTRLYAACVNTPGSQGCDPVIALDPATHGAWCARELVALGS